MGVNRHWTKDYNELAAAGRGGYYAAEVRDHHWGGFVFRAYPHGGSICTECIRDNKDALLADAERWLKGCEPPEFYSASY